MQKKGAVLFICYYFPPMGMGGTQRAAKFAKYIHQFGWEPYVVTVKNVHYYAHDPSLLDEVKNVPIYRTGSLDPLRLFALFKRKKSAQSSPRSSKGLLNFLNQVIGNWLFIPDSKILWLPFALGKSLSLIWKNRIKVVFTTSPPHSAHLAGLLLQAVTGIKWVADFRDDWTGGESQPCPGKLHTVINRLLEKQVLTRADRIIGMCDHLTHVLQRKSGTSEIKFKTIMNGYDQDDFKKVLQIGLNEKFTITHCGSISRVSNPEPFLTAVRQLFNEDETIAAHLQIQFIGTDIYGHLQQLLSRLDLSAFIAPIQYYPHQEALRKLMASHLLLATIIKKTDEEIITGKIFEYFASGKPILLIAAGGYIAETIARLRRGTVVRNDDIIGIKKAISVYFDLYRKKRLSFHEPLSLVEFDREHLTGELAKVFSEIT